MKKESFYQTALEVLNCSSLTGDPDLKAHIERLLREKVLMDVFRKRMMEMKEAAWVTASPPSRVTGSYYAITLAGSAHLQHLKSQPVLPRRTIRSFRFKEHLTRLASAARAALTL